MSSHWFEGVSGLLGAVRAKVPSLLDRMDSLVQTVSLPLVLLSLGVAVLAQGQLDRREDVNAALVLYGLAAVLFALIFWSVGLERPRGGAPMARPPAVGLLTTGLTLGFLSFLGFAHNRPSPMGLILWLGGLGLSL
ncbi:MAG TPA: hypothetical protein EYP55_08305, partial [Anaerolineae bacterium]|nr:hypothetical protein [Anaerolineae bacterium]